MYGTWTAASLILELEDSHTSSMLLLSLIELGWGWGFFLFVFAVRFLLLTLVTFLGNRRGGGFNDSERKSERVCSNGDWNARCWNPRSEQDPSRAADT